MVVSSTPLRVECRTSRSDLVTILTECYSLSAHSFNVPVKCARLHMTKANIARGLQRDQESVMAEECVLLEPTGKETSFGRYHLTVLPNALKCGEGDGWSRNVGQSSVCSSIEELSNC